MVYESENSSEYLYFGQTWADQEGVECRGFGHHLKKIKAGEFLSYTDQGPLKQQKNVFEVELWTHSVKDFWIRA